MPWINILAKFSAIFVYALFGEFLYFALLQEAGEQFKIRRWVYRIFGDDRRLTPFISTGTYILFALLFIFFLYFFESLTNPITILLIEKLSWQVIFFFIAMLSLFVFWTAKFTIGRRWTQKWVWMPLVVLFLDIILWAIININK